MVTIETEQQQCKEVAKVLYMYIVALSVNFEILEGSEQKFQHR